MVGVSCMFMCFGYAFWVGRLPMDGFSKFMHMLYMTFGLCGCYVGSGFCGISVLSDCGPMALVVVWWYLSS